MNVKDALKAAQTDYWRFDRNRDRAIMRRQIAQLSALGWTPTDIAATVGCTDRQVHRTNNDKDWNHGPMHLNQRNYTHPDVIAAMEELADAALDIACRLRDQDPQIVWDALEKLDRHTLQELAVVLAAAIPTDHTKKQLYSWITTLGDTQ